jgi:hypothetical protein
MGGSINVMLGRSLRAVVLVVGTSVLIGCGSGVGSQAPSLVASASPATSPAAASAAPVATVAVTPSAEDWKTLLTLVACPLPRSTDPACLDAAANGATPAKTTAVKVGGEVKISVTVNSAASSASPPMTLLLFTFEPPLAGDFIKAAQCSGCVIDSAGTALEWPGLGPGDHVLTATLLATGHPTAVAGGTKIGDDYEWLAGFFALPTSQVLGQPDGINTDLAFALATGETTIHPR